MVARNTDGPLLSNLSVTVELFALPLDVLREIPLGVSDFCSSFFNFVPLLLSEKYLLPSRLLIVGSTLLVSSNLLPEVLLDSLVTSVAVKTLPLSVVLIVLTVECSLVSNFGSELITEAWIVLSKFESVSDCADLSHFVLDLDSGEDDTVVASSSDLELNLKVPRFVAL